MTNQRLIACSIAIAFWPLWVWYFARTFDRADEPWGLLALATIVALLLFKRRHDRRAESGDFLPLPDWQRTRFNVAGIAVLAAYVLTLSMAPYLVQSIMFVLVIWLLIISRFPISSQPGMLGLMILALPIVPSLNFFAGYPLRLLVTAGAAVFLNCLGVPAIQDETLLSINGQLVAIDAPCSGIQMLWAEGYTVMLLSSIFGFGFRKTTLLSLAGLGLILLGNVLRATTLVLFDRLQANLSVAVAAGWEPVVHITVGLVVFSLVTAAIVYFAMRLASRLPLKDNSVSISKFSNRSSSAVLAAILVLCLTAATMPFLAHPTKGAIPKDVAPTWPAEINGVQIVPIESLKEEQAFAADFPGQMRRFTDGTNAYFVRFVRKETRQLHQSTDCFKGLGYSIDFRPLIVSADGKRWSSFEAAKGDQRYLVMERIYDEQANSWTDVSEWYWSASLGKSRGPWFDVTIAKPVSGE